MSKLKATDLDNFRDRLGCDKVSLTELKGYVQGPLLNGADSVGARKLSEKSASERWANVMRPFYYGGSLTTRVNAISNCSNDLSSEAITDVLAEMVVVTTIRVVHGAFKIGKALVKKSMRRWKDEVTVAMSVTLQKEVANRKSELRKTKSRARGGRG
ncbi:hypothetical protein Adt_23150 [Abeliophyllum distichum]|uniref:Uncharacterized protein n=1 Tax=Abeliophyllum distichum TaxID=126358 RepID=A0ABD1SA89_9LAMI